MENSWLSNLESEVPESFAFVVKREVLESNLLGHLAGGREKVAQKFAEIFGADAVEIVLAFATGFDQTRDAEQGEMMADCGLALAEFAAEVGYVLFACLGKIKQDS